MCQSCWRGQVYCGDRCREAAQHEAHRKAQRRYRQTENGREAHRQAERKRRLKKNKKTVDDEGSTPQLPCGNVSLNLPGKKVRCHFCGSCGVIVKHFPRRGYGKKSRLYQIGAVLL